MTVDVISVTLSVNYIQAKPYYTLI